MKLVCCLCISEHKAHQYAAKHNSGNILNSVHTHGLPSGCHKQQEDA